MKTLPVAVQVYSVREDAAADFPGTMKKLKAMGYDGVELAGLYGLSPKQIRTALDDAGIKAISAHVPFEEMQDDIGKVIENYTLIGCRFIAVPWLGESLRPGTAGFGAVVDDIARFGAACRAKGITLLYHNHDFEFARMPDGRFGLDTIFSDVPADLLQTELDTGWIRFSGQDPAEYIRKYAGRAPIVHLKDYAMIDGKLVYQPVGSGVLDVSAILEASVQAGSRWIVVEQDESADRPPMEAVEMSRRYLRSLGW
jgi:sugar phosphate isomerase/epimerase